MDTSTSSSLFCIRKATIIDVKDIQNIARISFRETYSPLSSDQENYMNKSYSYNIIYGWVLNPNMLVKCCVIDNDDGEKKNKIVGFSVAVLPGGKLESDIVAKKQAEIGKLYILSSYKRQGIGRLFMEELERDCIDNGIKKLYLGVYHGNINAIRFYNAMGFKQSSKPIMFSRNRRMVMNMKLYKKIKK